LRLADLNPTMAVNERILFLTKSYLDWNVRAWNPLGFDLRASEKTRQGSQDAKDLKLFNRCFYNAMPLLLTGRTREAFAQLNLACSLAAHCLLRSPYWILLRLLRLYSYPLWDRFPDIRQQTVKYIQALASGTLHGGHPLRPLLELWASDQMENDTGRVASLLRLSSDSFGPDSGLGVTEWGWIQDELCSLSYQRKEYHDALRIARKLSDRSDIPLGVKITAQHMVARCHIHEYNFALAELILDECLHLCGECGTEQEQAMFLQQTYSDLGYLAWVKGNQDMSSTYYQEALTKAFQVNNVVNNTANIASLRCRMEALAALSADRDTSGQSIGQAHPSIWALWAFCRPYS
jgi:hypothetical protein